MREWERYHLSLLDITTVVVESVLGANPIKEEKKYKIN